ncbi:MAG: hypothetical protein ABSC23_20180 [Bryobacteraceae bacterium]|jgi:hypothetical protein
MRLLLSRPVAAIALLLAMWGLDAARLDSPRAWVHPVGTAGPVRILRFYASVGALAPGQTAQLCYGVENAKSVRISPWVTGVAPSASRCLEVVPERTTHYTIMAEGYDGAIAMRSLTLPVEPPPARRRALQIASEAGGVSNCWRIRS